MIELSRYALEVLRKDEEFILYRGRSQGDASQILVLSPVAEYPKPESLKRLEHECSLREALDPAWSARPIAMARHLDRTVLELEDPGGAPLDQLLGYPLDLALLLRLAVSLSTAIEHLHERGIIHKDIKPANVLVNPVTGQCWLRGFGIASRLARERQPAEPPEFLAGTLAYMAPEQTGRMNRSIDCRSDLYALGVTLYEMLTGSLPFTASDPMEWVHCHVARKPVPPSERFEKVPAPVSAIIMKLLAKTAEERYQTAAGAESDLRRCLREWETQCRVSEFALGEHDTPDRLLIPEKLYGRASEIDTLLASFDRVVASGVPELVLVSGYSGIGKSSVVNELHKVLVLPRGLFASGKFDQYKRDIPYATLAQAFQNLIRPLLSKREAELQNWRDALREALGPNGQLMVNLVPELKLIIGEQPPVPELPPPEAQGRFQLVFRRFIGVFARREHPLALFLDDLQWLDTATLDLLEELLTRPDVQHLILIGAYRDNEVNSGHALMRKLEAIRQAGAIVQEIILAALAREDLSRLIADALEGDCWRRRRELIFSLELHRAECEFLTGQLAAAEERLAVLSSRAANTVELATVACLRVDLYTTLGQSDRAVAVCLEYLKKMGIEWSPHPTVEEGRREYEQIWSQLGNRAIEDLIELPLMSDPASLATLDVLTKAVPPALYTDANLLSLAICRMVNLSLERGNSDGSCFAYVMLGIIAGPRFGNYNAGFRFGSVGYELVEKRGLKRFQARTYSCFGCDVMPWTKHFRVCRDLLRRAFEAQLKSTGILQPYEREYFRNDGTRVPVLIGAAIFEESQNEGVAFVLDLSEQKRAEEALRQSQARLAEAQAELAHVTRLTTLGEMTASIAHEISQPLTAIATNANASVRWLAKDSPNLTEAREAIGRIIRDGNRASNVISRMRALFKKAPAAKEPLDINEVMQEVLTLTQTELQRNRVSLRTQFANDLPIVIGDKIQLQQVILNLVVNAIEAMSGVAEGPRELCVSSQAVTEIPGEAGKDSVESNALTEPEAAFVLIAVRDSGPGLDSTELKRVFDTFYTTKSQGMGLGLAISRSIIAAHRGRLWVTTNAPKGAVFQFTLPCS